MVDAINSAIATRTNTVILEPRGGAKTTWGNTINLTKLVADNPDIRIGLISNTAKQANDFSRAIRWTMESNDKLHEIYGNLVSTASGLTSRAPGRQPLAGSKDVTLYAAVRAAPSFRSGSPDPATTSSTRRTAPTSSSAKGSRTGSSRP
jgi:hypothetical protein